MTSLTDSNLRTNGYKLTKNKDTLMFEIFEHATNNIVYMDKSHDKAYEIYVGLKNGKGFEGWSPAFFLIDKTKKIFN